ncbi:MAG: cyclopropane-fatty-acyl-phospholipid synthase family protein, partial [Pirellulaceae bacterium]
MISCPAVEKKTIRYHYDLSTPFYRLLWGPHIHHGLWDGDESPDVAQLRLTEMLAHRAQLRAGHRVLDVGCGMGGSSIHLARQGCRVTGVTLSKVQCYWARCAAVRAGVRSRVRILRDDAEQLNFPKGSFDIVWTIECTEHFFDKPRFLERAAAWLPTGGRLAICTWLAGEDQNSERTIQQVREVCEGFFCPSLASMEEYRQWLTSAGMVVEWSANLTRQVERTWEICQS